MKDKSITLNSKNKIMTTVLIILAISIIVLILIIFINLTKEENMEEYGVKISKQEMNLDKVTLIESSDEVPVQVPVPKGYVASSVESERTINGGFVIYEGEEAVTEENLETSKRTRNQWVWIPIEDVSEMYWTNKTDKRIYGARYMFTGKEYERETPQEEPRIIYDKYDIKSEYLSTHLGGISKQEFEEELQQRFYEMLESVVTYGGFYVGRYETGNIYEKIPVVKKMNKQLTGTNEGKGKTINWYQTYLRTKRIGISNQNVDTNILWEIQRDEVKKWLIDTGSKTNEEIAIDSTSWGNFIDSEFEYEDTTGVRTLKRSGTSMVIPAGSSEYTKANNIYDLVGNCAEWTMSVVYEVNRNLQGGYHETDGKYIVFQRLNEFYSPYGSGRHMGSRATLYIK